MKLPFILPGLKSPLFILFTALSMHYVLHGLLWDAMGFFGKSGDHLDFDAVATQDMVE